MISLLTNTTGWSVLAVLIGYISALLVAMSFHEFAHAFVANCEGDLTPKAFKRLTLKPLNHIDTLGFISLLVFHFGWAKPVPVNPQNFKHRKWGNFWVSIAGILMNLILAFIFSGIYVGLFKFAPKFIMDSNFYSTMLYTFLEYSIIINISLAIFNLLPIYPLDGFRIGELIWGEQSAFSRFMRNYSFIIMIILLISTLFSVIINYLGNGVISGFISVWSWIFKV